MKQEKEKSKLQKENPQKKVNKKSTTKTNKDKAIKNVNNLDVLEQVSVKKTRRKRKSKPDGDMYEKKVRNKETNIISFIFVGLFLLLASYMVYFNVYEAKAVINNSYNKRIDNLSTKVVRGNITATDGTVLAKTSVAQDGTETREYPYGNMFSHIVGIATHGKMGIEKLSNFYLLAETDNVLSQIYGDVTGEKAVGDSVVSTLDVNLQKAAYNAMGDNRGAVVAMDPTTGKVLALVSKPDYNPNDAEDKWDEWISYASDDSVLLNRATQGLYPPGSTFKILTTLEYIRENDAFADFVYRCTGSTTQDNTTIHCFDGTVHGKQTLKEAFAHSCNSAFATIGLTLDLSKYKSLCESFMFNKSIDIGIEYNQSSFTLDSSSDTSDVMMTAIGQGKTQITPLQNLLIASTVANGGVMMKPYFVDRVVTADNETVVEQYKPEELGTLMTKDEANIITDYMKAVISSGTGYNLKGTSYNPCGKTGSAQYDNSDEFHSWFVGFAPADNPKIAISVVLEGGYKNITAAQVIAKKVFDAYFPK